MRGGLTSQLGLVGIVLTLLGVGASLAALSIDLDYQGGWGPRTFPAIAAISLLIMGLIELAGALRGIRQQAPEITLKQVGRGSGPRIAALLVLAIAYTWLTSRTGYLLSTAVATPLVMLLFNVRNPLVLGSAALLCPLVYHAIFFVGLGVFPPFAEWFDLAEILGLN